MKTRDNFILLLSAKFRIVRVRKSGEDAYVHKQSFVTSSSAERGEEKRGEGEEERRRGRKE